MMSHAATLAISLIALAYQHVAVCESIDATSATTECASSPGMDAEDEQVAENERVSLLQGGLRRFAQKQLKPQEEEEQEEDGGVALFETQMRAHVNVLQVWNTKIHITQMAEEKSAAPDPPPSFWKKNKGGANAALNSAVGLSETIAKCARGEQTSNCGPDIATKALKTASSIMMLTSWAIPEGLLVCAFGELFISLLGGGTYNGKKPPHTITFQDLVAAAELGDIEAECEAMHLKLQTMSHNLEDTEKKIRDTFVLGFKNRTMVSNSNLTFYLLSYWNPWKAQIDSFEDTMEQYGRECIDYDSRQQQLMGGGTRNTPFNLNTCESTCWADSDTGHQECTLNCDKVTALMDDTKKRIQFFSARNALVLATKSAALAAASWAGFDNPIRPQVVTEYVSFAHGGGPLRQWSELLTEFQNGLKENCSDVVVQLLSSMRGKAVAIRTTAYQPYSCDCICEGQYAGYQMSDCKRNYDSHTTGSFMVCDFKCDMMQWCAADSTTKFPETGPTPTTQALQACGEVVTEKSRWEVDNFPEDIDVPADFAYHPSVVALRTFWSTGVDACMQLEDGKFTFTWSDLCFRAPSLVNDPDKRLNAMMQQLMVYNSANKTFQYPNASDLNVASALCLKAIPQNDRDEAISNFVECSAAPGVDIVPCSAAPEYKVPCTDASQVFLLDPVSKNCWGPYRDENDVDKIVLWDCVAAGGASYMLFELVRPGLMVGV